MPHAIRMANHEGYPPQAFTSEAMRGEVRIFAFFDDGRPVGALATKWADREDGERVGIFHWIAGTGVLKTLPEWLPQIEAILIRDHGVTRLQLTGRAGWIKSLKPHGYRRRKVILEKGAGE